MNILILNETGLFDWFATIVPIILSGVIVFFTFEQVKIAKIKRKDDLYDKRYKVYDKFREFASSVVYKIDKIEEHKELLREIVSNEFLFNDDVRNFIKEVSGKYNSTIVNPFELNHLDFHKDYMNGKINVIYSEDNREIESTISEYEQTIFYFKDKFSDILRDKFEPYLKLKK